MTLPAWVADANAWQNSGRVGSRNPGLELPAASPEAEGAQERSLGHSATHRQPYVVGLDDVIRVEVWKSPELDQEQAVRPDGKIAFKLVGEVQVEGLTIPELQLRLTAAYREYVPTAEVSVTLKEINSFKVYVLGRITKPGEYRATAELTVLQVLALAGPFAAYADVRHITVFRRSKGVDQRILFDYRAVVRGEAEDLELKPGDRLVVP